MNELVTVIANVALTLSFIAALIFGVAQVRAAARDRRERLTLDTLSSFQSREFCELMLYIMRNDLPVNGAGLMAMPLQDQLMFIQYGQQMESLGLLVAERLIDIDLVDKTLGSFVITSWEKYRPLFQDIRDNQPDPFLGEYFQWLAERIDERMKQNPRRPFFETGKLCPIVK